MKNKIILTILILSMIALLFSSCGGGGSVTPTIPDDEGEIEEIATQILETQDLGRQYFEQLESQDEPDALQKTVDYLKTQSNVDNAEVGEDGVSVWIEYKSGVEGIILTEPFRSLGNLSVSKSYRSNLPKKSADKNAIILLPFDWLPDYEDESADEISSYLKQSGYSENSIETYRGGEVTVDLMKTLYNYDFIYMATHGGVGSSNLIDVVIGQAVNAFSIVPLWNSLTGDSKEISIVSIPMRFWDFNIPGIVFALNSRFFANYTYPGSFVYMNACSSLKNDSLADVFLNNGASVYLGWDNTSFLTLGNIHNPEFFQELAKPNNTLQQAYDNTIAMHYPAIVYKDTNGNDKYRVKFLSGEDEGDQDDTIIDYDLSLIFKGNSQFIFNDLLTPEEIELIRKWGYGSDYVVRWPDGYVDVYDETNYSQMQEVINKWNLAIDGPVNLRLSSNPNSPVKVIFDSSIELENLCGRANWIWGDDYALSEVVIKINPYCETYKYCLYLSMFNAVAGFNYWAEVSPTPFDIWSNFNTIPDIIKKMVHALHKVPPGYYLGDSKQRKDHSSNVIKNIFTSGGENCLDEENK